jgi:hypothetical protein
MTDSQKSELYEYLELFENDYWNQPPSVGFTEWKPYELLAFANALLNRRCRYSQPTQVLLLASLLH